MKPAVAATAVAELIGDIYEAANQPDRWTQFLAHTASVVQDSFVLLGIVDREPRYSVNLGMHGLPAAAVLAYRQHYIRINPWIGALLSAPLDQPVAVRDLVNDAQVQRGEFVQDWLRYQPAGHPLCVVSPLDAGRRLCLTLVHAGGSIAPETRQGTVLAAIAPHLARAAQLMRLRAVPHAAHAAVLDMLSVAVIYTDQHARLVFANVAAEDLLRSGDGLACGPDRRLIALRPRETDRLWRYIRGAAQTSAGLPGTSGGTLRLLRRDEQPAALTVVAPVPHCSDGLAAVFIHIDRRALESEALSLLYDLTAAEAALAALIGRGLSLSEAAAERGVSLGTVQGQMKAILDKSNARNQADFVRMAMQQRLTLR